MDDTIYRQAEPSYEAVMSYCKKRNLALIDCGELHNLEYEAWTQKPKRQKGCWTPVSEHMPEEDFCTGRGIQHSAELLATIVNHGADDETFVDMMVTADGEWKMVHPIDGDNDIADWCEVVAWMPLPEPYKGVQNG